MTTTTTTTATATTPRYQIRLPTSTGDSGSPSESCARDVERALKMIEDERHICAVDLLQSVRKRLEQQPIDIPQTTSKKLRLRKSHSAQLLQEQKKDFQQAKDLLGQNAEILADAEERGRLFRKAKQNLNVNDDWTLAQTLFGVTTYYRREQDGSLSIKLEGSLDGVPLFDQVAVLREVDLHYRWAPFCSSSLTIAHLSKLDTVGWFVVGVPQFGLMRDACFRAIGCDSILEDGSIMLIGHGIADRPQDGAQSLSLQQQQQQQQQKPSGNETVSTSEQTQAEINEFEYLSKDPILKELELPAPPTRMGSGRMTIRKFQAIIHVESPTSAKTKIIANVDPNLPLIPQSLLDFMMKKLCGVLLSKLQSAAKKVSKDPIYNPHACKMREEEAFYKEWLMEKFKSVCTIRGWEMPPVSAFELTDQQLDLANSAQAKRNRNKSIKLYHSLSGDKLDDLLEAANNNNNSAHTEPANIGQGPPIRALSDSDSVSELSHNSGSTFFTFWRNNPVAVYMREVEEKTELKKAREVEKARERAANRLKPKSRDEATNSRLEELRAAKTRRIMGQQKTRELPEFPPNATSSQRNLIIDQHKKDWATFWTSHDVVTKTAVITVLSSSLFSFLYMEPLFQTYMTSHHGSWWIGPMGDIVTLVYLGISAFIHFVLCYVALMYAFSALQIGSIAGQEARKYYSEYIHLIVAVTSGSMVVLGMIKASLSVLVSWLTYKAAVLVGYIYGLVKFYVFQNGTGVALPEKLETIEAYVRPGWDVITSVCGWAYSFTFDTVSASFSFVEMIFKSNPVCRGIWGLFGFIFEGVLLLIGGVGDYITYSVSFHEGEIEGVSWRQDAYATTRTMLAYSAFFLLAFLLLFNLQAQSSRGASFVEVSKMEMDIDEDNSEIEVTSATQEKETSELTTSSRGRVNSSIRSSSGRSRSRTPAFDPIEEGSDEGATPADRAARSLGTPQRKKRIVSPFKKVKKSSDEKPLRSRATSSM